MVSKDSICLLKMLYSPKPSVDSRYLKMVLGISKNTKVLISILRNLPNMNRASRRLCESCAEISRLYAMV